MSSVEKLKWVEAAKILADDPNKEVACPRCYKNNLKTHDEGSVLEPCVLERILFCPGCGAKNYMRLVRQK